MITCRRHDEPSTPASTCGVISSGRCWIISSGNPAIRSDSASLHVDFETQRRIPKASARFYSEVIRTNGAALEELMFYVRIDANCQSWRRSFSR